MGLQADPLHLLHAFKRSLSTTWRLSPFLPRKVLPPFSTPNPVEDDLVHIS